MENPGKPLRLDIFEDCQNRTSIYGNITFTVPRVNCTQSGTLPDGYHIEVRSTVSDKFYLICEYNPSGIRCYTEVQ